jgi:hypothetical protein
MDPKVEISKQTITDLMALGVTDFSSYLPGDIFSWKELLSFKGLVFMVIGGFLVGFGTRYANGCTSGHSISGLSNLQFSSLVATISFFCWRIDHDTFLLTNNLISQADEEYQVSYLWDCFWNHSDQSRGDFLVQDSGNVSFSVIPHVWNYWLCCRGWGNINLFNQKTKVKIIQWRGDHISGKAI